MSGFGIKRSNLETVFQAEQIGLGNFLQSAPTLTCRVQCSVNGTVVAANDIVAAAGNNYPIRYYNQGSTVTAGTAGITREISGDMRITGTAAANGGNAYLLPWEPNAICMTELRSGCRLFVTATLNGCAIVIAGGRCNPVVAHVNDSNADATRNARYEQIARALEARGLDAANRRMAAPGQGYTGGNCAIFGIQGGDQRWTFYVNDHRSTGATTTQIWP